MSNQSKRVKILIPDGNGTIALSVIRTLGGIGGEKFQIFVISATKRARVKFSRYTYKYIYYKPHNPADRLSHIRRVIEQYSIDVLLPVHDHLIYQIQKNGLEAGYPFRTIPLPTRAVLETVMDKVVFAKFALSHGISVPPFCEFKPDSDFQRLFADLGETLLFKPACDTGNGRGIYMAKTVQQVRGLMDQQVFGEKYIVQKYIDGQDVDCSVLCQEGRIIAHTIQRRLFQEEKVSFQATGALHFEPAQGVLDEIKKLTKVLDWSGVAHVDLRQSVAEDKFYIVDVNPRFWRSLPGSVYAGVNFVYLAIQMALQQSFGTPKFESINYLPARTALRRRFSIHPPINNRDPIYSEITMMARDPLAEIYRLVQKLGTS